MKQNSKTKAFTLSEMIIVLILTSIVVGLAFSVLSLVQKHMSSIQENYNNTTVLNKLETALWLDFNRYNRIVFDTLENELKFVTALDSVSYKFHENYIIKGQDTFNITLENKVFYFVTETVEDGRIDALKLETTKVLQNQQLFVFKQNDASTFMK
ncbi:PulJ/GspJ family protein [Olleya namhaensis]|uniref:Type II secretory pathway, pseudopilin PulG n=1 Tax=Olleya namhaensis TaxID=1144750 RepID=A0A1I3MT48_9FLAO|nr:prepilin-type N-terminal cleavage/methylation domain-containing protein [Olleya namhaensis]SFJ00102.1 Type II secretory pathway, pseudopilin PulG [Olleya namhaensis]